MEEKLVALEKFKGKGAAGRTSSANRVAARQGRFRLHGLRPLSQEAPQFMGRLLSSGGTPVRLGLIWHHPFVATSPCLRVD